MVSSEKVCLGPDKDTSLQFEAYRRAGFLPKAVGSRQRFRAGGHPAFQLADPQSMTAVQPGHEAGGRISRARTREFLCEAGRKTLVQQLLIKVDAVYFDDSTDLFSVFGRTERDRQTRTSANLHGSASQGCNSAGARRRHGQFGAGLVVDLADHRAEMSEVIVPTDPTESMVLGIR